MDPLEFDLSLPEVEPTTEDNTIGVGEFHPIAPLAFDLIKATPVDQLLNMYNVLKYTSTAETTKEFSKLFRITSHTLNRILTGQVVSDRYVLGLYVLIISPLFVFACSVYSKEVTNKCKSLN